MIQETTKCNKESEDNVQAMAASNASQHGEPCKSTSESQLLKANRFKMGAYI